MMNRQREAAVWERVRSASCCAPEPVEPPKEECKPVVHNKKRPTCQNGLSVCGDLPLLVGLLIILRARGFL